ncbi:MAG: ADP-ribosylation factor-like protein [Cyanobacteria bacterium P01_A01_bin.68]
MFQEYSRTYMGTSLMEVLPIIITGCSGAGKTTIIRTISDLEISTIYNKARNRIGILKESSTVGINFGRLIFAPNQALHLYETPDQSRFDILWEILFCQTDPVAVILLVDAHRPDSFQDSVQLLEFIQNIKQVPILIGVTHTDSPEAVSLDEIVKVLSITYDFFEPKIVPINPTEKASVIKALIILAEELMKTPFQQ